MRAFFKTRCKLSNFSFKIYTKIVKTKAIEYIKLNSKKFNYCENSPFNYATKLCRIVHCCNNNNKKVSFYKSSFRYLITFFSFQKFQQIFTIPITWKNNFTSFLWSLAGSVVLEIFADRDDSISIEPRKAFYRIFWFS